MTSPIRTLAFFALAATAALTTAAPGQAAVTIGSSLVDFADVSGCTLIQNSNTTCTSAQSTLAASRTAEGTIVSPFDGVIVKWRVKVGSINAYTSGSSAALVSLAGNTQVGISDASLHPLEENKINDFTTRLSIPAGGRVGLVVQTVGNAGTSLANPAESPVMSSSATDQLDSWFGTPATDPTASTITGEVLVNAKVEPDADHDGYGDETQDGCPTDPATQAVCVIDKSVPVISAVSISDAVFRVDRGGVAARRLLPRGTRLRYTLSESSTVAFTIERVGKGRKSKGKCKAKARRGKRCKIYKLAGSFKAAGITGKNEKPFSGKIGTKTLGPAKYRATLVATDAAGNLSAPRTVSLKVVK